MKLSGLNAIITGANQGLGLEIARFIFAKAPASPSAPAIVAKLDVAAAGLRSSAPAGQKIVALRCDVSDPAAVKISSRRDQGTRLHPGAREHAGIYAPRAQPRASISPSGSARSKSISTA